MTEQAIVEQLAYSLANPAKAGFVNTPRDWPGFVSCAADMVMRRVYPACVGDNPYLQRRERAEIDLRIVPPPGVEDVGARVARVVALVSVKKFRIKYAEAMRLFRARKRHVVFTHGTWKTRVMFNVRVERPPESAA